MAKNPAMTRGTKIGSAARIPATTMTKAAAVNNKLLLWVWEGGEGGGDGNILFMGYGRGPRIVYERKFYREAVFGGRISLIIPASWVSVLEGDMIRMRVKRKG